MVCVGRGSARTKEHFFVFNCLTLFLCFVTFLDIFSCMSYFCTVEFSIQNSFLPCVVLVISVGLYSLEGPGLISETSLTAKKDLGTDPSVIVSKHISWNLQTSLVGKKHKIDETRFCLKKVDLPFVTESFSKVIKFVCNLPAHQSRNPRTQRP